MLDDADVLRFIKEKREQHGAEDARAKNEQRPKSKRPYNYMRSLQKHEKHLENAERPFLNNPRYDENGEYLQTLVTRLEEHVKLTKTELLMIANHRPHGRELLLPMIEDIEARFSEEQQQEIVDIVVDVLGRPKASAPTQAEEDASNEGDAMTDA